MKRSWLVETTTVLRSHAGVTFSPIARSRSPCSDNRYHITNDSTVTNAIVRFEAQRLMHSRKPAL